MEDLKETLFSVERIIPFTSRRPQITSLTWHMYSRDLEIVSSPSLWPTQKVCTVRERRRKRTRRIRPQQIVKVSLMPRPPRRTSRTYLSFLPSVLSLSIVDLGRSYVTPSSLSSTRVSTTSDPESSWGLSTLSIWGEPPSGPDSVWGSSTLVSITYSIGGKLVRTEASRVWVTLHLWGGSGTSN